jgi:hypothetical protein
MDHTSSKKMDLYVIMLFYFLLAVILRKGI